MGRIRNAPNMTARMTDGPRLRTGPPRCARQLLFTSACSSTRVVGSGRARSVVIATVNRCARELFARRSRARDVVRGNPRWTEQQASECQAAHQVEVERRTRQQPRQEQVERAWLTKQLARSEAKHWHAVEAADPAGRARLRRNPEL